MKTFFTKNFIIEQLQMFWVKTLLFYTIKCDCLNFKDYKINLGFDWY